MAEGAYASPLVILSGAKELLSAAGAAWEERSFGGFAASG